MRMSIKGAQFLKIEEELKYVNQYLYIQKMRFQEHIICLVEIPEQLYEYYIPKLMIQPLLENAIVHGVFRIERNRNDSSNREGNGRCNLYYCKR